MSNFWKDKKVIVTGAGGFIGSHLVENLIEAGAKVTAFVLYNSFGTWGWLEKFSASGVDNLEIMQGDVQNYETVKEAIEGQDIVFHLASLISIPYSYQAPGSYVDTNVKGTTNVLDACRAAKIKRMIHTSTSEVYGTAQYVPIDEKHPLQPQSPYSASKIAADNLVLSYYYSFDLPVSIIRPFNTFGPRQSARAVIPAITSQIYSGKTEIELGDLTPTRDFNYVQNTVDGFMSLAEAENVEGEIFNVGSGREISIKDLVDMIIGITGKEVTIVSKSVRKRPQKSEVKRLLADCSKMQERCHWAPRVTLEEGLQKTSEWVKENMDSFKPSVYSV